LTSTANEWAFLHPLSLAVAFEDGQAYIVNRTGFDKWNSGQNSCLGIYKMREVTMNIERTTSGAFNQGGVPTIACFNNATVPLGVDFDSLMAAMQKYIDACVAPVWGTPATLIKTKGFKKGAWAMVFLDNADQPGALAYHDLTPEGLPVAKVFVKTTLDDKELVSISASHELVEMLVDPAINMMTTGPEAKATYDYECADPVEEEGFPVNGIQMSDFVYPAYFEVFRRPKSVKFDHMNLVTKPFQILKGGYQVVTKSGKSTQKFGSKAKKKRFEKEDRRGHRSETRRRGKMLKAEIEKVKKYFG
jgi:hypothetical protein